MNNRNIKPISPFILFCQKVIPLAFDESMSYYECLCALVNYLYNEVVPAVNNNADAVTELQNYVKNYFDNLDVQDEINNKLDEMAESGQLADIVAQYLQLAGVLAYDTKNDMKNASNLTNGSICKTLGDDSYNDGKGNFYKIRTITSDDTVDDDNIVALNISNTLIAEKIPKYDIIEINNKIDLINSNDTIFLGDSYAAGTTFEHGSVEYLTSWCEYLRQIMGLTTGHYYIYAQGNAGFAKIGNQDMNFKMTLESHLSDITDKNIIKNIIVCAGYNDWNQTTDLITQRIGEFISFCKTNFPNATVYIGMIGGDSRDSSDGRLCREQLITRVLQCYNKCSTFGGVYLTGVENFTHNFYQFNEQGNHPNEAGYHYVANMIYNAWKNGNAEMYEPISAVSLTTNFGNTLNIQGIMNNDTKTLFIDDYMATNLGLSNVTDSIQIVPSNTNNKVAKCTINGKLTIPVDLYFYDGTSNHFGSGRIEILEDGSIIIKSTLFAFFHTVNNLVFWGNTTTHNILMS